ncbi:hypothetical protein [Enterococcus casseliflavus]|uniref:hypothetical protein n=1 Tax=Enterococcus casseliflavus TaxID=37734 RepID=UPI0018833A54|nr:hypothetical protein [Enterococcus casseliflavus]MBE9908967.1 hypothetical protein [Enterococcus casseliflavus]
MDKEIEKKMDKVEKEILVKTADQNYSINIKNLMTSAQEPWVQSIEQPRFI